MMIHIGFYLYVAMLGYGVIALIFYGYNSSRKNATNKFKNKRIRSFRKYIEANEAEAVKNDIFKRSGLPFDYVTYQMARYIIIAITLASVVSSLLRGNNSKSQVFVLLAMMMLSQPIVEINGKRTPFGHVMNFVKRSHRRKLAVEISNLCTAMKSLILQNDKAPGSVYLLRQLQHYTRYTSGAMSKFRLLWDVNKREEAVDLFKKEVEMSSASVFISLFTEYDEVEEASLYNKLNGVKNDVMKERRTYKDSEITFWNLVIFMFSSLGAVLALINMIMILMIVDNPLKMII